MYSAAEASKVSGIQEIWEASEFEPFIRALRNRQPYRPQPEKILMSSGPATSTSDTGFEKLFTAASNNDANIYLLVPGSGESLEYRQ
jgi:hypothetical protein